MLACGIFVIAIVLVVEYIMSTGAALMVTSFEKADIAFFTVRE